jgi:small-conductance mechanosensitive channel
LLSVVVAAITIAWSATAQDTTSVQASEAVPEQPTAPVVVDGVELFRVRGVAAYPPAQRAAEIAARIRALSANRAMSPDSIKTLSTRLATFVYAGDTRVLGVTNADAQLEGLTPEILAEVFRRRVVEAVVRYRHDREPGYLWRRAGYALAATVAFVLFMSLGRTGWRRLRGTLAERYRERVHDLQIKSVEIVRGEQLWQAAQRGMGFLGVVLAIIASYVYLHYVLRLFPWSRGLGNGLGGMVVRPLQAFATAVVNFIPDLVVLILLVLLARFVIRFIGVFFKRVGSGAITLERFDPEWALPAERILRLGVVVFTLIIAYPYIPGSGSEAFKGIGLILGLMFSLGSPSVIGNLVAGMSLAVRKAFRVGDRVKIGEHLGFVTQVRLLTTYMRSMKNEEIVIPNSLILNNEVVNYSTLATSPGLIMHTTVGIGYETPWRQVEAMLLEAARRTPGVLENPPPYVLQQKLGDFAVDYEINAYTQDAPRLGLVYSDLHRNILDLFNEYGVQIMTPAYEGDPDQPKVVPRAKWYAAPARPIERVVDNVASSEPGDVSMTTRTDGGSDRFQRP